MKVKQGKDNVDPVLDQLSREVAAVSKHTKLFEALGCPAL